MGLGDWLLDIFGPHGELGVLIFIALIFFIDALVFPTLPELFFVISLAYRPGDLIFGLEVLAVVAVAEVIGITLLYLVVEKIKVPKKLKNIVDKYTKFLIVSDERILLVNRVAPVIPFAGAFISLVESWRYTKCMLYVVLGCLLKYGAIMLVVVFLGAHYGEEMTKYTIVFIFVVIGLSLAASLLRKRKLEREGLIENS